MPDKKMAVIVNGIVTNVAVWDGVQPWNPASVETAEIPDDQRIVKGSVYRTRGAFTYNIVVDGNSIARGYGLGAPGCTYDATIGAGLTVDDYTNKAADGATTTGLRLVGTSKVDSLYNAGLSGKNILIFWEGGNDLAVNSLTATQAYDNIKAYCQNRKSVGWKIIIGTITPRTTTDIEVARLSCNQMIRDAKAANETWLDAVADVASDSSIGQLSSVSNPTYYTDGLHPKLAGHNIAKTYFQAALTAIM